MQAELATLAHERETALRVLLASRSAATPIAQREYWCEFAWLDQEYRALVRRVASFCTDVTSERFGETRDARTTEA